jgi:hypothetical protein
MLKRRLQAIDPGRTGERIVFQNQSCRRNVRHHEARVEARVQIRHEGSTMKAIEFNSTWRTVRTLTSFNITQIQFTNALRDLSWCAAPD